MTAFAHAMSESLLHAREIARHDSPLQNIPMHFGVISVARRSWVSMLLTHPAANTHAITSVTHPPFRRQGLKKSRMVRFRGWRWFGFLFRGRLTRLAQQQPRGEQRQRDDNDPVGNRIIIRKLDRRILFVR